ncbi:MAG: prepilin-type N-terminal cleavage/methylation domain-containing protein [Candidatus Doudnabacteria bacterium]|nr:prepilin-type N-terminal cleavage/methylation domain-containing protein [Candidatus Doudnabacteria bacterium]
MHSRGFTLIELLVSIAVFSVIMVGIVSLFSNVFTVNRQQGSLLSDQDQVRKVSFQIMTELRNAITSNLGAYPIDTADNQQLIFYTNSDGGTQVERVRYYIQNGNLYRGVVVPAGSPLSYNLASETVRVVQNNLSAGSTPIFYYYDDTYDGITGAPLVQPVNKTAIRFVKVVLPIANKAGVQNTNSYSVTAMATIRSLKTNLAAAAPPPVQPPTVTLQANNTSNAITIAYNSAATLSWTSTNTNNNNTTCTASGGWSGSTAGSGTQSTGALATTQTYTLQCTGPGGTASSSVTVNVSPAPAPTVSLLANGSSSAITIAYNASATLSWSTTTVDTNGCIASGSWSGTKATSGTATTGALTTTQTYTLQCTGPGGTASGSVTVNVTAPPPPQPSCVSAAPGSNNAFGNGAFNVYAYGVANTTSMDFDIYKNTTHIHVAGTDQGGGTWIGTFNLSAIPSKGFYTVNVYVSNANYTDVLCASTQFRRR